MDGVDAIQNAILHGRHIGKAARRKATQLTMDEATFPYIGTTLMFLRSLNDNNSEVKCTSWLYQKK